MRTGRPIGDNMREICGIVEKLGWCGPSEVYPLTDLRSNTVRTYLHRAVDRGMLVRDGKKYKAARNWEMYADGPPKKKPTPLHEAVTPHVLDSWLRVNL
jgi:hypothetical protein